MKALLLGFLILLVGCASNDLSKEEYAESTTFDSRERMIVSSGNSKALIDFYKNELLENEREEVRLRLVEAYVDTGDYDSAAFHLEDIELTEQNVSEVAFLKAKVFLAQGKVDAAYARVQTALSTKEAYAEAENLMGLILAEKMEYQRARDYFLLAKRHYYDDLIVTNNLAVLDLLEGNYAGVVSKLNPIYMKGEADLTIKSNLVLANVKLGRYQQVETILKEQGYKEDQIQSIFVTLHKANSQLDRDTSSPLLGIPVDSSIKKRVKVIKSADYEENN